MEYPNICTWALSLGYVIPVEEMNVVHQFNGKWYSFHSQDALKRFQKDSQKVLLDVVKVMYQNTDLMIFLEKADEFSHLIQIKSQEYRRAFYATKDGTNQTERNTENERTSPMKSILFLRRKGLQLANKYNYKDNSCQTEGDHHYKQSSSTQTIGMRTKSIQTGVEKEIQTDF